VVSKSKFVQTMRHDGYNAIPVAQTLKVNVTADVLLVGIEVTK